MLRTYFVRHGETDWNIEGRLQGTTDVELNAKGLAQAGLLAERLAGENGFAALYTSPLRRASVTSDIIGGRVGLTPIADGRLVERSMGDVEGMTGPEVALRFPEFGKLWHKGAKRVPFPSEEPREHFQARIEGFLQDLQSRHTEGQVIVVMHGGAMGMIMALVMRLDLELRLPFWFDNASINIVEFGGPVARVLTLNDTCHLRSGFPHPNGKEEAALDAKANGVDARSIVQSAV